MAIDMQKVIHMGRRAYENGLPCRPSKDKEFMAMLNMLQGMGGYKAATEAVEMSELWTDGWKVADMVMGAAYEEV